MCQECRGFPYPSGSCGHRWATSTSCLREISSNPLLFSWRHHKRVAPFKSNIDRHNSVTAKPPKRVCFQIGVQKQTNFKELLIGHSHITACPTAGRRRRDPCSMEGGSWALGLTARKGSRSSCKESKVNNISALNQRAVWRYDKVNKLTLGPSGPSRTAQTAVPQILQCAHRQELRS